VTAEAALVEAIRLLGPKAKSNHPIGPLTTYRVGGRAGAFLEVETEADLEQVRIAVAGTGLPVLVIGRGSNLLVSDSGFPGIALSLGASYGFIEFEGLVVRAGAACSLPVLARRSVAAGLKGMEWGVGVPGSVGGAVRMNAGGHGSETSQVLRRCRLVDLSSDEDSTLTVDELDYSYRHSNISPTQVVLWAELSLSPGDSREGEAAIGEVVRWRREHQPGGQNAGSVFTNPPGDSAGRLVEEAGLKGYRLGTAWVSDKHANFIQADPGGSADDVLSLVDEVRRLVYERLGVELVPEVRVAGRFEQTEPMARGGAEL
jgi:UDP-N-acetylmuramate dehydrogenase